MLIDLSEFMVSDGWIHPELLPVPFVTCNEMKRLEQAADEAGYSYLKMMEQAGTQGADLLCRLTGGGQDCKDAKRRREKSDDPMPAVLVLCGKGNNGGDGYVLARQLSLAGYPVAVCPVSGPPVTRDAISNHQCLPRQVLELSPETLWRFMKECFSPLVVVDAIYGTGFHGTLPAEIADLISKINDLPKTRSASVMILSLDLPSGLSGDNGDTLQSPCIHADNTLAFHGLKPIHLNAKVLTFMGRVHVADIGIGQALSG